MPYSVIDELEHNIEIKLVTEIVDNAIVEFMNTGVEYSA